MNNSYILKEGKKMLTKIVVKTGDINKMFKEIQEHMEAINILVWKMNKMGINIVVDIDEEKAGTKECQPKE